MIMIDIKGVSKTYGKHRVLKDISLLLKSGESVAMIGPNGSGKTTLIKIILQLVMADQGDIKFKEKCIKNDVKYRSLIGYMPQMSTLPEAMTVNQLFSMMQELRSDVKAENCDWQLYEAFNISEMGQKALGKLSGGMRQKVNAALAYLFNPEVLLLDEPTASLDPISSEVLREKIADSSHAGKLIMITSHNLNDLDGLVGRVVYLMDGEVFFDKSVQHLKQTTSETRLNKMIVETLSKKTDH